MQARTIILADHSGTVQAETHSQRFYISGHCGGISSVTCCLWLVNTQCVFSPGMTNNRGNIRTLHGHESCAWRSTLFPGRTWGMLVELRVAFVWFSKQITQKCDRKKKRGETSCAHKEWRSSDKWCGLLHHLKGGGGGGGHQSSTADEIQNAMENKYSQSSAIWFLICYLPWQCKSNTVSK